MLTPPRPWFSAPMGPEADSSHEVVDLAVALAVDDPARLALRGAAGSAGQTRTGVAVLDRLNVPEVPREAVEL
jgi:hypothetical protein